MGGHVPAGFMTGPVTCTSGQTLTGWVNVGELRMDRDPLCAIYCVSGGIAHMIIEAAYVVVAGVAESSEILYPGADFPAAPGANMSVVLVNTRFPWLRVSASSDTSSSVYGGVG